MSEIGFIDVENIEAVNNALAAVVSNNFADTELVEVRYFKQYGTPAIELLIWKKDGITLSDCEAVHNAVSAELDKLDDFFKEAYILNVSSLGLDRKIVTDDDFRRALDTEIECVDINKKKTHGVLKAYDSECIVLLCGAHEKNIKRNILTKVQLYVRF